MKTCPVCQLAMEASYLFCPDDGASLSDHELAFEEKAHADDAAATPVSEANASGGVVLYCPTCAAEYPLTFATCPVHRAPLVRHRIPRLAQPRPHEAQRPESKSRLTLLHLERPTVDRPQSGETFTGQPDAVSAPRVEQWTDGLREPDLPTGQALGSSSQDDHAGLFPGPVGEVTSEPRSFRIAAIATVAGLSFFGILALYFVVANSTRRRVPPAAVATTRTESTSQSTPFVPTPPEARDYEEPSVDSSTPAPSPTEQNERAAEKKPGPGDSKADKIARIPQSPAPSTTPSPPSRIARVSSSPMPPLPRGDAGGFDARLIRVRSIRTTSGVRYDLTFNILEQAGRPTQWQRLLISTRSASGLSHSQAVPFVHRLGPAGALTFTVSVEMPGRSEADWQGRVLCTALGWDNNDRPLQSSFGANVIP